MSAWLLIAASWSNFDTLFMKNWYDFIRTEQVGHKKQCVLLKDMLSFWKTFHKIILKVLLMLSPTVYGEKYMNLQNWNTKYNRGRFGKSLL